MAPREVLIVALLQPARVPKEGLPAMQGMVAKDTAAVVMEEATLMVGTTERANVVTATAQTVAKAAYVVVG